MLCGPKKFKRFLVRSGDLKHRITIQDDNIGAPKTGVDASITFTDIATVYAAMETVNPKHPFDGINIDEAITHRFYVRHIDSIQEGNFVLHRETRYRITQIVNIDGLQEWLRLDCNLKGDSSKEASKW